jgi:hypothetical protein
MSSYLLANMFVLLLPLASQLSSVDGKRCGFRNVATVLSIKAVALKSQRQIIMENYIRISIPYMCTMQ